MISILLCTYNGEKYLQAQLESLLEQTLRPLELVVCDDASSDSTLQILYAFQASAPFPVCIVRNRVNLGFAENFLHGITLTRGECVAFCDQDDLWYPTKLQYSYSALRRSAALLVAHGFDVIDASGSRLWSTSDYTGASHPDEFFPGPVSCAGFSLLMDKRLLDYAPKSLAPDTYRRICGSAGECGLGHDSIICLLASVINLSVYIKNPLAAHRIHGYNATQELEQHSLAPLPRMFRKAVLRWRQRGKGGAIYAALADSLDRQYSMLEFFNKELQANGFAARDVDHALNVVRLRRRDNLLRSRLYSSPSSRFMRFVKMLFAGCYRQEDGGLGTANAWKDCLVAIFPPCLS